MPITGRAPGRAAAAVLAITVLAITVLGGCADGREAAGPAAPETSEPASQATILPPGIPDPEWYDEDERAAEQETADVDTVWLAGWFAPEALAGPTAADMEPRWRKAWGLSPDPAREELVAATLAALEGPGPIDLVNLLEGVPLRLRGMALREEGGRTVAVLGFDDGITASNGLGAEAGAGAAQQFLAVAGDLFPDADAVLVTVAGAPAERLFGEAGWDRPVPLPDPGAGAAA